MKNLTKSITLMLVIALMSFTTDHSTKLKSESLKFSPPKTSIQWKSTEIDLGEITQNKPVTIEFEFTNNGEEPVIITSVQASCGCTSTNYVKTPILPKETTRISAVFNAAAKGVFKKQVTVITNAEETPKALVFSGTVI